MKKFFKYLFQIDFGIYMVLFRIFALPIFINGLLSQFIDFNVLDLLIIGYVNFFCCGICLCLMIIDICFVFDKRSKKK